MILCEISRGSSQDTNIFLGSATRATAVAVWSTGPPIYYAINIEGCRQIRELAAKRNVSTTSHWAKSGRLLRKLSIHALLMLLWTIWSASPLPTTLNRLTCDLCFETVVTMLWLSMALRIATDPGVWCIIFNQRCWQSWLVSSNREIAFILHWIKFRELHLSCIGSSSERSWSVSSNRESAFIPQWIQFRERTNISWVPRKPQRSQWRSCENVLEASIRNVSVCVLDSTLHLKGTAGYKKTDLRGKKQLCSLWGSNSRPPDYETDALPTELKERGEHY